MTNIYLLNGFAGFLIALSVAALTQNVFFSFLPHIPIKAYVVSVLLTPLALLFTDYVFLRILRANQRIDTERLKNGILWMYILTFICFFIFVADTNILFDTPFLKDIYKSWTTYFFALIPLTLLLLYTLHGERGRILEIVHRLILISMLLISLNMGSYLIFNELHRYNENTINFQIVLNPIVQVFLGNGSLVETKSQYGLYGQFFEPILRIVGFNLTAITSIFAALVASSLFMIGLTLYKVMHNKMLALIGFIAYIFAHYFATTLWPGELYLQYWPIRTLFPAVAFFLFYRHLKNPSWASFTVGAFILSLGVLWNMDVGIVSFASYILSSCLLSYSENNTLAARTKKILLKLTYSIAILASTFFAFALYIRVRYLAWPDFSFLSESQGAFLGEYVHLHFGQYNLWIMVVAVYIVGLAYIIRRLKEGNLTPHSLMIAFCIFLGLGILTYHANNAWPQVLGACAYPSLFVILIYIDFALKNKNKLISFSDLKVNLLNPQKLIVAGFIGFFVFLSTVFFLNLSGPYIKPWVRIHELLYPDASNDKAIWALPSDNQTKMGCKYILVRDLVGPNKTEELSTYLIRAKALEEYFNGINENIKGKKIIIFSMWDASLYLKLQAPSALNITDAHHAKIGNQFPHIIERINEKRAEWIIFDTDKMFTIGSDEEQYKKVLAAIEENYIQVKTLPVGKSYYGEWSDSSLIIFHRAE